MSGRAMVMRAALPTAVVLLIAATPALVWDATPAPGHRQACRDATAAEAAAGTGLATAVAAMSSAPGVVDTTVDDLPGLLGGLLARDPAGLTVDDRVSITEIRAVVARQAALAAAIDARAAACAPLAAP